MKPIKYFLVALLVFIASAQNLWAQEEASLSKLHCPSCSAANLPSNKFCNTCGSRLPVARTLNLDARDSLARIQKRSWDQSTNVSLPEAEAARALYERAMALVGQSHFAEAAICFRRLEKEYPALDCAKQCEQMAKACEELVAAQKQAEQKTRKGKASNGAAFGGAFLGSLAGTLGTIVVLVMIASGG